MKAGSAPSFHIMTFGCQMNERDSEWIAAALLARGFTREEMENADVLLVNTCSVREKPELKVKKYLERLGAMRKDSPLVGVLGCAAQQLGEKLFEFSPLVRLVAGGDAASYAPDSICELLAHKKDRRAHLDFSPEYQEREALREAAPAGSAYVSIMQGCDNFCAYCIVPFTRGRQKSRSSTAILEECAMRVANGASDISLLGQNVNAYGKDLGGSEISFPRLLEKAALLPGLKRLRFLTPHPRDLDPETIAAFGEIPQLCPRLHLPLQSGSDRILKAMRRRYDSAAYLKLIEGLRRARPDIALSTDLIVGFPGERDEDFLRTLDLMQKSGFMSSFSFCYSDRPGARASLMPEKVPAEIMHERLLRLQELQEKLGQAWLAARVGHETSLLLERPSPRRNESGASWQGRDIYGAAVHVDLPAGKNYAGEYVNVEITAAKKHSLMARLLSRA